MRRLGGIALVVLVGLIASACSSAGAVTSANGDASLKLNGDYRTRIESEFQSGALNGVWRLRLGNGAYTLNFTGKTLKNVIISGVYTAKDGRITFRDHSAACSEKSRSGGCQIFGCHQRATYTFTLTRTTLTFARLRDHNADCELPVVLPSPFHRVR